MSFEFFLGVGGFCMSCPGFFCRLFLVFFPAFFFFFVLLPLSQLPHLLPWGESDEDVAGGGGEGEFLSGFYARERERGGEGGGERESL